MTPPAAATPVQSPVDVGVTLGELDGHTVVVGALATAGITTQFQLPPAAAAQLAIAVLCTSIAGGVDPQEVLTQLEAQLQQVANAGGGLHLPDLADVLTHGGRG